MSLFDKYHYDESGDQLHIETVQDVEPIFEKNKRLYNDAPKHGFKSEIFNKKAEIPMVVLLGWCQRKGISYQEFMGDPAILRRFLNDPENKFCLCRPGKV